MIVSFSTQMLFDDKIIETKFVEKLGNGMKKHTVRGGFRWDTTKNANVYTGARSPMSKHHFDMPVLSVQDVVVMFGDKQINGDLNAFSDPTMIPDQNKIMVFLNGHEIAPDIKRFSRNDGFDKTHHFRDWFWQEASLGAGLIVGQVIGFHPFAPYNAAPDNGCFDIVQQLIRAAKNLYMTKGGRDTIKNLKWQSNWRSSILECASGGAVYG